MKLNELKPNAGAKRTKLVVGRGIGSGKGKTCGSGQKGQKSRSGVAIKGFEGGQMPLDRRLPKFGFSNAAFSTKLSELNIAKLEEMVAEKKIDAKKTIDEDTLVAAGIVRRKRDGIKIIGNAAVKTKFDLKVTKVTKGALASIEKAGGKVELIVKDVAPVKKRGEKTDEKTKTITRTEKKSAAKKA